MESLSKHHKFVSQIINVHISQDKQSIRVAQVVECYSTIYTGATISKSNRQDRTLDRWDCRLPFICAIRGNPTGIILWIAKGVREFPFIKMDSLCETILAYPKDDV